jgi:hypothetical protein
LQPRGQGRRGVRRRLFPQQGPTSEEMYEMREVNKRPPERCNKDCCGSKVFTRASRMIMEEDKTIESKISIQELLCEWAFWHVSRPLPTGGTWHIYNGLTHELKRRCEGAGVSLGSNGEFTSSGGNGTYEKEMYVFLRIMFLIP